MMSTRRIFVVFLWSVLAILTWSCSSKKGFQGNNIHYLYDTRNLALRPEFYVYHDRDSSSRVHYRINSSDLLYVRDTENASYKASFSLTYFLVPSYENTTVLDSGRFSVEDIRPTPARHALTGYFNVDLPVSGERKYILRVIITDGQRQVSFESFIEINKEDPAGFQNFLLTDTAGNILFKNHVATGTPFYLAYNKISPSRYYVSYYHRDFPLALPPYSSVNQESFDLEPDSVFMVDASQPIVLQSNGFYHFRQDTAQWAGFTVYSFYDTFPYIAKRVHLGEPLRYLTTKKEYDDILSAGNDPVQIKKKVDAFWLERSGSLERSKILVRSYYGRVQEANIFFSSYLEGWKTDRGIIYVIYGPPDKVYRSSAGEAWVYGDEASSLSYYFNFIKVSNPFSDNDYSLNRMGSYRYGWGQAIESWRNGRVYNSKDIQREQDQSDQYRYRQRAPYWY